MAEESVSEYVDKFRLINEPTNHWEARKLFLTRNWDDYPEMQLVSLSMVWANMQFDGCKYSAELMERVESMAAGILSSDILKRPAVQDQESDHTHNIKRHKPSSDNKEASIKFQSVSHKHVTATSVNGATVTISPSTALIPVYPSQPTAQPDQVIVVKLRELCAKFKAQYVSKKNEDQSRDVLLLLLSNQTYPHEIKYREYKQSGGPWKAYYIICDSVCATTCARSKKLARQDLITLLAKLWRDHRSFSLRKASLPESANVGFGNEMVYMDYKKVELPVAQKPSATDVSTGGEGTQKKPHKVVTADTILESLPLDVRTHEINCAVIEAPVIPKFVLYESAEGTQPGYHNPVAKLVNSTSMCKLPINFDMEELEVGDAVYIKCTVHICGEEVGTGLGFNKRDAKHLACSNASKALRKTNATLWKIAAEKEKVVHRDELTEGSAKVESLPESNVGHKMLKMMGWKGEGSGLGKTGEGIANPVAASGTNSMAKEGLGFDLAQLTDPNTKRLDKRRVWNFLQDYVRSDRDDELVFACELSLDERKELHNMSQKLGLKSKSRGKGDDRYLTIGRKWDVTQLVKAVAAKGGSMGNYELVGPSQ